MGFIESLLFCPAAFRLINRRAHGPRDRIGIHITVPSSFRRRGRLSDERCLAAQEPFLIGVQNSHKRHLWKVEAFA